MKNDTGFKPIHGQAIAGIISFKNFGQGLMTYAFKPNRNTRVVDITHEVLGQYEQQLFGLITELMNPEQPFVAASDT